MVLHNTVADPLYTPNIEDTKLLKLKKELEMENDISAIKIEHPNNFMLEDQKF